MRSEQVRSFDALAALRREEDCLVIAPHPFFPGGTCLGRELMDRHAELIDAVEWNAMFTRGLDFNAAARKWAGRHRKPVVGNGDVHRLRQLGSTFTLVDAAPNPAAICEAVRQDRVTLVARPLPWLTAACVMAQMFSGDVTNLLRPRVSRDRFSVAGSRS